MTRATRASRRNPKTATAKKATKQQKKAVEDEDVAMTEVEPTQEREEEKKEKDEEEEEEKKEEDDIKKEDPVDARKRTRKSLNGKESEIRFGAMEIVAVYMGGEEGEEAPYSFAVLINDVMYGDSDDEVVNIEWLEFNDRGNLEKEDVDPDEIAIGSFICPVTVDVIELSDGSYQVPATVHSNIKTKLECQLSDDYDPVSWKDEEPSYETRMRKKRR